MANQRAKWGCLREIVMTASVNNLPAKIVSKQYGVLPNSLYRCAKRMNIQLPQQKRGRKAKDLSL